VEVKLGKPRFADVVENGVQTAWEGVHASGMLASGESQGEWIEIVVGVELQPWPDGAWLTFWREEDLDWPERFEELTLDGRKLIFTASEDQLEEAWGASRHASKQQIVCTLSTIRWTRRRLRIERSGRRLCD
jgi:hypothetical protein